MSDLTWIWIEINIWLAIDLMFWIFFSWLFLDEIKMMLKNKITRNKNPVPKNTEDKWAVLINERN